LPSGAQSQAIEFNDGSLLFLLTMIAKRNPSPEEKGEGSKIAIVFNGSPLFTGDAGSGESNIRRWIIENDWLDAIILDGPRRREVSDAAVSAIYASLALPTVAGVVGSPARASLAFRGFPTVLLPPPPRRI
jgi:hypothetical protein